MRKFIGCTSLILFGVQWRFSFGCPSTSISSNFVATQLCATNEFPQFPTPITISENWIFSFFPGPTLGCAFLPPPPLQSTQVYYIKAPGNYSLHFRRINVVNSLVSSGFVGFDTKTFVFPVKAHLSGEIGVTLQVPILEGPAGKLVNPVDSNSPFGAFRDSFRRAVHDDPGNGIAQSTMR